MVDDNYIFVRRYIISLVSTVYCSCPPSLSRRDHTYRIATNTGLVVRCAFRTDVHAQDQERATGNERERLETFKISNIREGLGTPKTSNDRTEGIETLKVNNKREGLGTTYHPRMRYGTVKKNTIVEFYKSSPRLD